MFPIRLLFHFIGNDPSLRVIVLAKSAKASPRAGKVRFEFEIDDRRSNSNGALGTTMKHNYNRDFLFSEMSHKDTPCHSENPYTTDDSISAASFFKLFQRGLFATTWVLSVPIIGTVI